MSKRSTLMPPSQPATTGRRSAVRRARAARRRSHDADHVHGARGVFGKDVVELCGQGTSSGRRSGCRRTRRRQRESAPPRRRCAAAGTPAPLDRRLISGGLVLGGRVRLMCAAGAALPPMGPYEMRRGPHQVLDEDLVVTPPCRGSRASARRLARAEHAAADVVASRPPFIRFASIICCRS